MTTPLTSPLDQPVPKGYREISRDEKSRMIVPEWDEWPDPLSVVEITYFDEPRDLKTGKRLLLDPTESPEGDKSA